MLRAEIQTIIEKSSTTEEAGCLISYLLVSRGVLKDPNQFSGDGEMQTLLRDVSSEMDELLKSFGIDGSEA